MSDGNAGTPPNGGAASGRFGHLKKLETKGRTRWLAIPDVAPGAKLHGRPATEANEGYLNGLLSEQDAVARVNATGRVSAAETAEFHRKARKLYVDHVIIGWEGVVEKDGTPVEFTPANLAELLDAIPDWMFNRIRAFFESDRNFIEGSGATAKSIAGNSSAS